MSNPFKAQFDSTCNSCGAEIFDGDDVYAVDGDFVCEDCAEENGNICECGNFKKAEYEKCYECFNNKEEEDDDNDYPFEDTDQS